MPAIGGTDVIEAVLVAVTLIAAIFKLRVLLVARHDLATQRRLGINGIAEAVAATAADQAVWRFVAMLALLAVSVIFAETPRVAGSGFTAFDFAKVLLILVALMITAGAWRSLRARRRILDAALRQHNLEGRYDG